MGIDGLLGRILTGDGADDPGAIGLLYQWYAAKIYRAAFYVLNDQHFAEDVVQETFITAMSKIDTLRDPAKVEAWLVRTAINKSYEVLRGNRKAAPLQIETVVSEGDEVLDHLLDNELRKEVICALRQLPPINQEVVYYKFFCELNSQEISTMLKIPGRTVRSRLERSLELIAIYLGREVYQTDATGREN